MPRFAATIYKLGINPVVDPPERVLKSLFEQAGRTKGPIRVLGKLNGTEFRQTLVKYAGAWRLYVNGVMLKASGAKIGHRVRIEIEYDPRPRRLAMPPALGTALLKNTAASDAFEKLTPSRRAEVLKYIGALKTPESIKKNVERVIRQLISDEDDETKR